LHDSSYSNIKEYEFINTKVVRLIGNPYNSNSKTNIFTKTKAESGTPFSIIDGSSLIISEPSPDCSISIGGYDNVCAYLYVDTNGVKKPNRYGKDVFGYYLRSNQITPFGLADDTSNSMTDLCSKSSNSAYNGIACTGWVIYNKNLEYQKCSYGSSGIQWNVSGKNTCS